MSSSSWANAYRYDTDSGQRFFVKEAKGQDGTMFKGEALGLQAMYGMPRPSSFLARLTATKHLQLLSLATLIMTAVLLAAAARPAPYFYKAFKH